MADNKQIDPQQIELNGKWYWWGSVGHCEALEAEVKRLQATIVDQVLETADGVRVVSGMEVWDRDPWGHLRSVPVRMESYSYISKCYSSREAAEAAGGKDAKR